MGAMITTTKANARHLSEVPLDDMREFLLEMDFPFDARLNAWERWVSMQTDLARIDPPLRHTFPGGMYVREITMPAGAIITSRIHRFQHPFFILRGRVTVITRHGFEEYHGGYSGITEPGARRILLVHEETVWTTVHLNGRDNKDIEELEGELTIMPPFARQIEREEGAVCHS